MMMPSPRSPLEPLRGVIGGGVKLHAWRHAWGVVVWAVEEGQDDREESFVERRVDEVGALLSVYVEG